MKLLSVGKDAKTIKGEKVGILTGILYFAPHNLSGYQVCPKASEGCKSACLFTAGYGIYKKVKDARINRTLRFFQDRAGFFADLVIDIKALIRKAEKLNMVPCVRLNGTSDIAWEKFKVLKDGIVYNNIMFAFPHIQFYDYTKIIGRKAAIAIPNYHLTFSLAENNDGDAKAALFQGYNVAVVMNVGRKDEKPTQWSGFPVINGDESDVRFNDPKGGHIISLTAKGFARKDTSGFVRKIDSILLAA